MTHNITTSLLLIACTFALCCSEKDNSPGAPAVDWTTGRGTAACHEWQRSYCELAARCEGVTLVTCATQYQGIECSSDTTATNCATSLDAATCTSPPTGCNATDIANTAPANQGCNDLYTAVCTHNTSCGDTTPVATCVTDLQGVHDCSAAIGLALSYQDCMTQINAAACSSTALPTACDNVILMPQ
jgi:hypothetical protein